MKRNRAALLAGLGIIIVTNTIALAGAAYNRSGQPDAVVDLSERELSPSYDYSMSRENTGLALHINCRINDGQNRTYVSTTCYGTPHWLDEEKLIALGFEPQASQHKNPGRLIQESVLSRKVFLVLEHNGAAYKDALTTAREYLLEQQALLAANPNKEEFLKRTENAQERLAREQDDNSRLFAIDAGRNQSALRVTYPDTDRYIVIPALVKRPTIHSNNQMEKIGRIDGLLVNTINIPLAYRAPLEALDNSSRRHTQSKKTTRYTVRVAFGKRAEPWVVAVVSGGSRD